MPTNQNPTKSSNDLELEDQRERRQEQAAPQSRGEMGHLEEGAEAAEADVHERQTSRMDAPDDEEVHVQGPQGRQRSKSPSGRDETARADDRGDDAADDRTVDRDVDRDDDRDVDRDFDRDVDRDVGASEDKRERDGSDVVSAEDSESESDNPGRARASQAGRSKQSINASKRPRDQRGRFEASSRKKHSDDSRGGDSSSE